MASGEIDDPRATIDAWRERGADRLDPVRFGLIDALARRSAGHCGAARRLLDARLASLVAAYGEALARAEPVAVGGAERTPKPAAGPLAGLVGYLASHTSVAGGASPAAGPRHAAHSPYSAPAMIDYFRDSWARVSAEQQLRQALDRVPPNAGPLNSHHLVHGSLALMRELSPGYFQRFLSYVDGLSRLEQMTASSAPRRARVKRRGTEPGPLA